MKKKYLQKILSVIKSVCTKDINFCEALLIVLTFALVLNVSINKGSKIVNQLQMDKNPHRCIAIRDYVLSTRQGQSETMIHTHAQYLRVNHIKSRLKQPVRWNNSNGSLKIDIMISQIFNVFPCTYIQ